MLKIINELNGSEICPRNLKHAKYLQVLFQLIYKICQLTMGNGLFFKIEFLGIGITVYLNI